MEVDFNPKKKGGEIEKPQNLMDRLLNPKQLAEILNIKLGTLYSHLSRGTDLPPFIRVGSQTRWRESKVWDWIKAKEKARKKRNFEL